MGKIDVSDFVFLKKAHFNVLQAIERKQKRSEYVSVTEIRSFSKISSALLKNFLSNLCSNRLLSVNRDDKKLTYRLTKLGFIYLSLHHFVATNVFSKFGNQIGMGKESTIFQVSNDQKDLFVLKIHELGRTSFRSIKKKRNYLSSYKAIPEHLFWKRMSQISASREAIFLSALHKHGFPVPKYISHNRNCVVMELIDGVLLSRVYRLRNVEALYMNLMDIVKRFAEHQLVHGDFNEFNIMINKEDESPIIIDFPQMMSMSEPDARKLFERDVECIRSLFENKFSFVHDYCPEFDDIVFNNVDIFEDCEFDLKKEHFFFKRINQIETSDLSDDDDSDGDDTNHDLSSGSSDSSDDNDDSSS